MTALIDRKDTSSAQNPDVVSPSTQALAYLGDSVVELFVRERLVRSGLCASDKLNSAALEFVTAPAQSAAVERIIEHLDERETGIYHRGRNAGHGKNTPRKASVIEYRRATGFEVLMAQLYLDGNSARLCELLELAYPTLPKNK